MRKLCTLVLLLILCFAIVAFPEIEIVKAQGTIYIRADGSVWGTDKIQRDGNFYSLSGDIIFNASEYYGIKVETDNIVIDGAGYTIQGAGIGRGIEIANPYNATIKTSYNVTVKNINIKGFETGIAVFGYWGNIIGGVLIAGNNITRNDVGIRFSSYSSYANNIITGNNITLNGNGINIEMGHYEHDEGNIISGNHITKNQVGMAFLWLGDYYSWKPDPFYMNNQIYNNNFIANTQNVVNAHIIYDPDCANIWDNGVIGNYWSNYNGTDSNSDGIGDKPYIIDQNNQDSYPLMEPTEIEVIPEFPSWIILPLLIVATMVVTIARNKLEKRDVE